MPESLFSWSCSPRVCNFTKKRLWHRCFPVNFVKIPRTPFSQNTFRRLLLTISMDGFHKYICYKFRSSRLQIFFEISVLENFAIFKGKRVSLNYATIHHDPPPANIYPPPTTTSQYISTTTYHFPKNGPPPRKSQNILIYNLLLRFALIISFSSKINIPFHDGDFVG